MTTPTLEDLIETFTAATKSGPWTRERSLFRAGLLAVLDALQPVVAEAFAAGDRKVPGYGERPGGYATRIIAQLKGESRD